MRKAVQIIATLVILLGSAVFAVQKYGDTELVSPTPLEVSEYKTGPVKTYTSKKLGISFQYVEWDFKPEWVIEVREEGNTIFVDDETVTVFQKIPSQSLEQAIRETLLQNYPNCGIDPLYDPGNIQSQPYDDYRVLHVPPLYGKQYLDPTDPEEEKNILETCPIQYQYIGGIGYFAANTKHPDRFLFVRLGNGVITPASADRKTSWNSTIRFIEK